MAAVLVPYKPFEPAGRLLVSINMTQRTTKKELESRLAKCRELAKHAAQGGTWSAGNKEQRQRVYDDIT